MLAVLNTSPSGLATSNMSDHDQPTPFVSFACEPQPNVSQDRVPSLSAMSAEGREVVTGYAEEEVEAARYAF